MKKIKQFLYKIWSKFLTFFGDIKIFKYPFWMVYDPDYFQMTGDKIIEAMRILEPADCIFRGYNHYLDGCFINGDYSHGAIYIGDDTIIHAVAPKVDKINVIDFMECDRIVIFRPKKYKKAAIANAKKFLKEERSYDFDFNSKDDGSLFCFELVAKAFDKVKIPTFILKKFFGLIKKEVYLEASFENHPFFEKVFEYNPKKGIYFKK